MQRKWIPIAALACGLAAVPANASARSPVQHTGCAKISNVEAIVDDSGSMASTDPNRLRMSALDLFVDKPENAAKTFGAVEFGEVAGTAFAPQRIGGNGAAMKGALDSVLDADNGGTDYNLAFGSGKQDNPNAQAWVFLTDGGHNIGDYHNGHTALGGPVYVIGLGIGAAGQGDDDADRLQQIASDTGGVYYPQQDASTLQSTMTTISSLLSCRQQPTSFSDTFTGAGQSVPHSLPLAPGQKSVDLTITFSDPSSKFDLAAVQVVRGGRVVASTSARPIRALQARPKHELVRLKLTKTYASTYVVARVANLVPGTLKFKVVAKNLGNETAVITQASR